MILRILASLAILLTFSSCAGYRLGNSKPAHLQEVRTISVPLFKNDTQEQRLAVLATNSCIDAITRDGSYRIGSNGSSDATLYATISKLDYDEFRSQRLDTLKPEELEMTIYIDWQLKSPEGKVLASGRDHGETKFFVDANLQLSRENSLPDAVKNATEKMASRLANGF
ncbi:Lipopolysaccharide-assembly [Rubritalea squalenifaciens DSM 18772]|uniref:Lipopolysaccharide-assembly n=1 Tax=Rubritalea squalenifaciens DSM 18772 TaxID=1123071 RepID=A0A1M6M6T6_9BACT|nr:LPS assembly lipoprotein LptE [Rubritalea squalenifaciens]SHJ78993.1 Lipopolysaccharide-assembly [Rubritalea squalenifaciens DSM 18772]